MSGHKSFVTMGPESSWGSAPSAMTHKLEILPPWDVAAEIGEIEDGSLYNSQSPRGFYAGGELARGPFGVRANYEGVLELLRGVLPTYSATDVEAGVVRDHLFKEGPTLKSYHFDASEGDIPVGKVARIAGTKLTRFTLAGTAGVANLRISGPGAIVADHLVARQAAILNDGSGNVALTANGPVSIRSTGSGDVSVAGKPICTVENEGTGRIQCGTEGF